MKIYLTIFALLASSLTFATAQSSKDAEWEAPMYQVNFKSPTEEKAEMKIDKGYRYADLDVDGRDFHLFYNRDIQKINKMRVVDSNSDLQVARGRGSYLFGTARIEFIDGEIFKVKKKSNANGYEIIGPYGTLFKVENHAIKPIKSLNEKDFLVQAFYVFERIKITQSIPSSDVMIFYSTYNQIGSNE